MHVAPSRRAGSLWLGEFCKSRRAPPPFLMERDTAAGVRQRREDECDVMPQSLRHPALRGAQPCQLLGVAKAGLDIPATALTSEQDLPTPVEIVANDVVQSSLAVRCHDESEIVVSWETHGAPQAQWERVLAYTKKNGSSGNIGIPGECSHDL
jgi:hypothetical protein